MKKILNYSIAAFLLYTFVSLWGCKKDEVTTPPAPPAPVADFTFSGAGLPAPCTVTFTNNSTNATSYDWDFGDGSSSSEKNPQHIYTAGGIYTVSLAATGTGGNNSKSKTVNIDNANTKIIINKLKLLNYPQTDPSGAGWDINSGPDMYWVLSNESQSSNYFISGTIYDALYSNLPFTYSSGLPYTINNLNKKFTITFYDKDSPSADDWMSGYYFTPSANSDGYPSIISFHSPSSDLAFDLYVTWANSKGSIKSNNTKVSVELTPISL